MSTPRFLCTLGKFPWFGFDLFLKSSIIFFFQFNLFRTPCYFTDKFFFFLRWPQFVSYDAFEQFRIVVRGEWSSNRFDDTIPADRNCDGFKCIGLLDRTSVFPHWIIVAAVLVVLGSFLASMEEFTNRDEHAKKVNNPKCNKSIFLFVGSVTKVNLNTACACKVAYL